MIQLSCALSLILYKLTSLFFIQLSRNASVTFSTVVSVAIEDKLLWADKTLHSRGATASGSISTLNTAQLRLTLNKDIFQCPNDFKMYKCKMSGINSQSNVVEDETLPITVRYNSMYCINMHINIVSFLLLLFCINNTKWIVLMYDFVKIENGLKYA